MYMQDYNVFNDKEGIDLYAAYAIAKSIESEHGKGSITAQDFAIKFFLFRESAMVWKMRCYPLVYRVLRIFHLALRTIRH